MRNFAVSTLVVLTCFCVLAAADTWKNVPIVDTMCLSKVKDNPDAHPKKCLLSCASSGYGLLTSDGTYLKFDDTGNTKAIAALKATDKADHIRVTVTGERQGDQIKVENLTVD